MDLCVLFSYILMHKLKIVDIESGIHVLKCDECNYEIAALLSSGGDIIRYEHISGDSLGDDVHELTYDEYKAHGHDDIIDDIDIRDHYYIDRVH